MLETEKWECYVCKPTDEETGVLRVRTNWRFNVKAMFDPLLNGLKSANLTEESDNDKKPIRVLSLMDGIGSGIGLFDAIVLSIRFMYLVYQLNWHSNNWVFRWMHIMLLSRTPMPLK